MEANKETKKQLEEAKYALEVAQREGNYERASQLRFQTIPELESKLPHDDGDMSGQEDSGSGLMVHERVTSSDIARVVAKATGLSSYSTPHLDKG
jgi:ATP-dependent Clp protease ATP-binding subunit ClpB